MCISHLIQYHFQHNVQKTSVIMKVILVGVGLVTGTKTRNMPTVTDVRLDESVLEGEEVRVHKPKVVLVLHLGR